MSANDFRMPQELNFAGLSAAEEIVSLCKMLFGPAAGGGGCRAFYTPEEWKARGEEYGCDSILIVCHDGGSLAPMFNGDYEDDLAYQTLRRGLEAKGFYVECCTSWYSAVYRSAKAAQVKPQVEKILVLSTGHMPSPCPVFGPLRAVSHEFGFIVFVTERDALEGTKVPAWLQPCLEVARAQGCSHINFDESGLLLPELQRWDW